MISKNKLLQLIEPHFEKDLVKDKYEVKKIKANKLLTNTRFDLAFKLLYLDMINKDVNFSREAYQEHIRAFSLGKFTEPGNKNKNGIDKFIEDFHSTFNNIKINGFNGGETLIPLSINGSIANGAHRLASAIYLDTSVSCVSINTINHIYDYKFFYNRNVSNEILDAVTTKFVEYANNTYIAFIWPTAGGYDKYIQDIIPNIVYRKDIQLNHNGAHNLLSQIYHGEEWIGSVENNFQGVNGKFIECFKNFDPVRVVAFQASSLDEVLKIKDKIRDIFKVGKHSIHINDTKEEAIKIARMVFNDNSIHFLNYAKPNKYIYTHSNMCEFKEFIEKNDLDTKDLLIDSSFILSCYGLRRAKDIDFFYNDNSKIKFSFKNINTHDEELQYHVEEKKELIYNQRNYFYFNDLKLISFKQLYKMKTNRNEEKDKNDCRLMEALVENNNFKKNVNKLKQKFYYIKIKTRCKIIFLLQEIGIYNLIRKIIKG